ncbi:MAG: hypothetical protein ACFE9L_18085 [Candidatus Hodarchaeota archaeon]
MNSKLFYYLTGEFLRYSRNEFLFILFVFCLCAFFSFMTYEGDIFSAILNAIAFGITGANMGVIMVEASRYSISMPD